MKQGIAWVEGRPETARRFNGRLHRQWIEFVLGVRTCWPNPLKARRVRSFKASADWIRDPSYTARQWEVFMRQRKAWTK
jgi:hypothetical protein